MRSFRLVSMAIALAGVLLVPPAHAQKEKSPAKAVTLSLVSSLVPMGAGIAIAATADSSTGQVVAGLSLASLGAILGPATGRLYAGDSAWASGCLVRAAGVGLGIAGSLILSTENDNDEEIGLIVAGVGLMGAGAVLIMGSLVDDVGKASAFARGTQKPSWQSRIDVRPAYFVREKAAGVIANLSY